MRRELNLDAADITIHDVHLSTVNYSSDFIMLNVNSFLSSPSHLIELRTSDSQDVTSLARLLVEREVRTTVIELLGDISKISQLLDDILITKNKQVRLDNPLTDVNIIADRVVARYGDVSANVQFAMIVIMLRALKQWQLVVGNTVLAVLRDRISISSNYDDILHNIHETYLAGLISQLRFKTLSGGTTNTMLLASNIADAMTEIRLRLIALDNLVEAFASVLPRVRAYITANIEGVYTASEASMFGGSDFLALASNLDICGLALSQSMEKPSTHSSFWLEHDKLVYGAITNGDSYITYITPNSVVSKWRVAKIFDKIRKIKGLVVSRAQRTMADASVSFLTSVGQLSEVRKYSPLEAPSLAISNWIRNELNTDSFSSLCLTISSQFVFTSTQPHIIMIGRQPVEDIGNLAAALADAVYVDKREGRLIYKVVQNAENSCVVDSVPPTFFTDNPMLVLLCKAQENDSVVQEDLAITVPLSDRFRYMNINEFGTPLSDDQIITYVKCYSSNGEEMNVKIPISISSILGFTVPSKLLVTSNEGISVAIKQLILLYNNMAMYTGDENGKKGVKRFQVSKEMLSLIFSRFLGDKVQKMFNDPFILGVSNQLRELLRNQPGIIRDVLYYDRNIEMSIKAGALLFTLKLLDSNLRENEAFDTIYTDLINKYISLS